MEELSLSQLFNEENEKIAPNPNKKALPSSGNVLQHKEEHSNKRRGKREVFLLLYADDLAHLTKISVVLFGYSYDYSYSTQLIDLFPDSLCVRTGAASAIYLQILL